MNLIVYYIKKRGMGGSQRDWWVYKFKAYHLVMDGNWEVNLSNENESFDKTNILIDNRHKKKMRNFQRTSCKNLLDVYFWK